MRQRTSYSVSATVVVLIVLLAFLAMGVKPLIPSPPPNAIAQYPGDFLAQAAHERIPWRPMDPSAFAEARRLDRPVLLFIGTAWSQLGREFDQDVLSTPEVQNYLSRNYICIRVDAGEMPAWATCFLPLSRVARNSPKNRAGLGLRSKHQIWVLEPDTKLLAAVYRRRPESRIGPPDFLEEILRIRRLYTQLHLGGHASDFEVQQGNDVAAIEAASSSSLPDFGRVSDKLIAETDRVNGGFPQDGWQDVRPLAWTFLAQTGQSGALSDSLLPVLRSPAVDLIDGGFFSTSRLADWRAVETDKSAVQNAEMMWALCLASFALPKESSLCRDLARSTAGSLMGEFLREPGFISSARLGDLKKDWRSVRSSIPPFRLRDNLGPEERERARAILGLRVETNPQMLPFLTSTASYASAEALVSKLRIGLPEPRFASGSYMDVNATVAARLMEAGRAMGDDSMVRFGSGLFERVEALRVDDQVPHDLEVSGRSPATLVDYLAYADAAVQDYLANGRVVSLLNGQAVLQRALVAFAGRTAGEFFNSLPPSSELLPPQVACAQVVDDFGESSSAKVVRLCTLYGRLLISGAGESDPGVSLLRTAQATSSLMSEPATSLGVALVGFVSAAATLGDDRYAISVGPDADRLALELFRLRPTRLVAPAYGPVRRDLAGRGAGIYVVEKGQPSGPFSVREAAARLPFRLSPSF